MPTYVYQCINCNTQKDTVRSIHEKESIPDCDSCGYHMIRVYEPTAISFKGGGFYSTENRG